MINESDSDRLPDDPARPRTATQKQRHAQRAAREAKRRSGPFGLPGALQAVVDRSLNRTLDLQAVTRKVLRQDERPPAVLARAYRAALAPGQGKPAIREAGRRRGR